MAVLDSSYLGLQRISYYLGEEASYIQAPECPPARNEAVGACHVYCEPLARSSSVLDGLHTVRCVLWTVE